jgi:hypothetical protein
MEQEVQSPQTGRDPEAEAQVAAVLEGVRAGVRRRQAEVAALSDGRAGSAAIELETRGRLEEPVAVTALPVFGPLLILARKAMLKLFGRWYSRPLILQQTRFNQLLAQRFAGLTAENADLQRRVRSLEARLERRAPHDEEEA